MASAYVALLAAVLIAAVVVLAWRRKRNNAGGVQGDSSSDASTTPVQGAKPLKMEDPPTLIALGPPDAPFFQLSRALQRPDYRTEEVAVPSAVRRDCSPGSNTCLDLPVVAACLPPTDTLFHLARK